jgi:hypothetical protein
MLSIGYKIQKIINYLRNPGSKEALFKIVNTILM